jgi:hypothetical protein
VILGNQVYVDRSALPAPLVARCIRLAAFQNPEFYAAQAMRLCLCMGAARDAVCSFQDDMGDTSAVCFATVFTHQW